LLPLVQPALRHGAAVAVFTNLSLSRLSSAVEVNSLSGAADGLAWADFLAVDLPLKAAPDLKRLLGLPGEARKLTCLAQALVSAPMPCGGLGECDVCAVAVGRKWKRVCLDGPVFNLEELL
jgi:hypothetical protein